MRPSLTPPPNALESPDGIHPDDGAPAPALTRRTALGRAAIAAVGLGGAAAIAPGLGLANGTSSTAGAPAQSVGRVLDFIVTQEQFGVTFLTAAIRRAPGTPSAQFLPVLRAANTTEFDHVRALRRQGGRPLVSRYWIPDAAFGGGGAGLFASLEAVETIELSMYLIGVTSYTRVRDAFGSRLMSEAMATESEHRVLARFAKSALGGPQGVPNNISFAPYNLRTLARVQTAAERLGIGYGKRGAAPGAFYEYPGNPLANGTGSPTIIRQPA